VPPPFDPPLTPMGGGRGIGPPGEPPTNIPVWPLEGPTIDPRQPPEAPKMVVPEPASAMLLLFGAGALVLRRRPRNPDGARRR